MTSYWAEHKNNNRYTIRYDRDINVHRKSDDPTANVTKSKKLKV